MYAKIQVPHARSKPNIRLLKKLINREYPSENYHHNQYFIKDGHNFLESDQNDFTLSITYFLCGFGGVCFPEFFIQGSIFSENNFFYLSDLKESE